MITFSEKDVSETVTEFTAEINSKPNTIYTVASISALTFITAASIYKATLLYIFISFVFAAVIQSYRAHAIQEETVLIIKDFGIQLRRKYFDGREETKFLDKNAIIKVFIHEYIKGSSINYCLAFIVHNEPRLILLFTAANPGLLQLQTVYMACVADFEVNHSQRILT